MNTTLDTRVNIPRKPISEIGNFNEISFTSDAQTILTEESQKAPCQRYFRGECKFGGNCRFSHYNSEELNNLQCEGNTENGKRFPKF